jgi:hypothetical protein
LKLGRKGGENRGKNRGNTGENRGLCIFIYFLI